MAELDIATDAQSQPYAVQVTGNGTPAPVPTLELHPAACDSRQSVKVGTSTSNTTVHVTNSGGAASVGVGRHRLRHHHWRRVRGRQQRLLWADRAGRRLRTSPLVSHPPSPAR